MFAMTVFLGLLFLKSPPLSKDSPKSEKLGSFCLLVWIAIMAAVAVWS
jgi:hypothetical protein